MPIDTRFDARRALIAAAAASVMGAGFATAAMAQADTYPNKPVRLIVPFSAGGATDIVTRLVAPRLSRMWNQPVIVDNRGGAGGNIGADAVAKSAPDGYVLLVTSGNILTVNPHVYRKMPFDAKKDFVPITNLVSSPQVLVIHPSVPARSLKEFIAIGKINPGALNFGSAGTGSQVHMAGESFVHAAGIEAQHVPYRGESAAYADLIGGQIQFVVGNIAAAAGHVASGRAVALGVTSARRSPMMPDVPTLAEAGLEGFENTGWFGLVAPSGTPRTLVDRIHRDAVRVLNEPDIQSRLLVQGMTVIGNTPDEFGKEIDVEFERWGRIVTARKLQAD